ncbi:MAG: aminoglycoside phosphotransferase [Betaproteobacteria bacterium]|nr:aminoglycoside phosphotransferase [Betaproteobacteria bacterium]
MRPEAYPHPVRAVRVLETHISWVLLTGDYAYKVKKPVNLGFLDFSTLEARRRCCEEELRLNRRLAPDLYLEVVAIRGVPAQARIGGDGPALEYAVRMREFPQNALAKSMISRGQLTAQHVDELASVIAAFHTAAPVAAGSDRHGEPETVLAPALENFRQTLPLVAAAADRRMLRSLRAWTKSEHGRRAPDIAARRRDGFARECHGDLHLGNVAVLDGKPVAFDCIEFNAALRWIDVMNEVAFMHMDLDDRGRPDLAWRFLNRYLEHTGDYPGVAVLRFYGVYRALVRAKVHALRASQPRLAAKERARLLAACRGYVRLAGRLARRPRPGLIITHGLSGSGKTTVTDVLVERTGAVRVRSDLERKRLHGMPARARSESAIAGGIYAPAASAATYDRLAALARGIVESGYTAVVDAAFLSGAARRKFRTLARRLRAGFVILDFRAPESVLSERIAQRLRSAHDASEADLAVLEHQVATADPLARDEIRAAIAVDTTRPVQWPRLLARLRRAGIGPR